MADADKELIIRVGAEVDPSAAGAVQKLKYVLADSVKDGVKESEVSLESLDQAADDMLAKLANLSVKPGEIPEFDKDVRYLLEQFALAGKMWDDQSALTEAALHYQLVLRDALALRIRERDVVKDTASQEAEREHATRQRMIEYRRRFNEQLERAKPSAKPSGGDESGGTADISKNAVIATRAVNDLRQALYALKSGNIGSAGLNLAQAARAATALGASLGAVTTGVLTLVAAGAGVASYIDWFRGVNEKLMETNRLLEDTAEKTRSGLGDAAADAYSRLSAEMARINEIQSGFWKSYGSELKAAIGDALEELGLVSGNLKDDADDVAQSQDRILAGMIEAARAQAGFAALQTDLERARQEGSAGDVARIEESIRLKRELLAIEEKRTAAARASGGSLTGDEAGAFARMEREAEEQSRIRLQRRIADIAKENAAKGKAYQDAADQELKIQAEAEIRRQNEIAALRARERAAKAGSTETEIDEIRAKYAEETRIAKEAFEEKARRLNEKYGTDPETYGAQVEAEREVLGVRLQVLGVEEDIAVARAAQKEADDLAAEAKKRSDDAYRAASEIEDARGRLDILNAEISGNDELAQRLEIIARFHREIRDARRDGKDDLAAILEKEERLTLQKLAQNAAEKEGNSEKEKKKYYTDIYGNRREKRPGGMFEIGGFAEFDERFGGKHNRPDSRYDQGADIAQHQQKQAETFGEIGKAAEGAKTATEEGDAESRESMSHVVGSISALGEAIVSKNNSFQSQISQLRAAIDNLSSRINAQAT